MNCNLTNEERKLGYSCRSFDCVRCNDKLLKENDKLKQVLNAVQDYAEAGNIHSSELLLEKIGHILNN